MVIHISSVCVNSQLKSSKIKLNACIPKINSAVWYAVTFYVIVYHLVYFMSSWIIHKFKSSIDFFTSMCAVYSIFMNKIMPISQVFAE